MQISLERSPESFEISYYGFEFDSVEALADAKVRLLNDVSNMNLSTKHPYVPLRRNGEGRLEHEAGDLLSLFRLLSSMSRKCLINFRNMCLVHLITCLVFDYTMEICMC